MSAVAVVRRLRPVLWTVAALALIAIMAWRVGAWGPSTGAVGSRPGSAENIMPGLAVYPPGTRVEAPTLEGPTLDGGSLALSDLGGKIVVINVWGSWCAACRAEAPELARLAGQFARRGVRFVGINTRDNPDAAKAFVRTYKVPYPSVVDVNGRLLLNFRRVIPTSVVPSTVVVDRQGQVAARVIGRVTYRTLKGLLEDELSTSAGRQ